MRRSQLAVVLLCRRAHWHDPCCRGRWLAWVGEAQPQLGPHPELVTAQDVFNSASLPRSPVIGSLNLAVAWCGGGCACADQGVLAECLN